MSVELIQNTPDSPRKITGVGHLKTTPAGGIRLTILAPTVENRPFRLTEWYEDTAGKLVEEDRHYDLTILDEFNTTWVASGVVPHVPSIPVKIITASIRELGCVKRFTVGEMISEADILASPTDIQLEFGEEIRIPTNTSTIINKSKRAIDPDNHRDTDPIGLKSWTTDTLRFRGDGIVYELHRQEASFEARASGERTMHPQMHRRFEEALRFVTGRPLRWRVARCFSGGCESVRVRATGKLGGTMFQPPLSPESREDINGNHFGKLFNVYLALILTSTEEEHPCSTHLFQAMVAGTSSPEGYALGLSVAVEGISKVLFEGTGEPSGDDHSAIRALLSYIKAWPRLLAKEDPARPIYERLHERIKGSINNYRRASASDVMNSLVEVGAIVKAHIRNWKDLRHPAAHAILPDEDELQGRFDKCFSANVLIHHLVFAKIGYEGWYTDYSTHGFPDRYYRPGAIDSEPPPLVK